MKSTRTKTQKVAGVGINDADYVVHPMINGKQVMCHFYNTWKSMLTRCYSESEFRRHPTYKGCTVSEEWHSFMPFKNWMSEQQWRGKHLDKDIIKPNNKVYGPDTCMFVSKAINNLLTDHKAARGRWPQGVAYEARRKKQYKAQLNIKSELTNMGYYNTPEEAHAVYCVAKADHIESLFPELKGEDPRLIPALQRHADNFRKKSREQSAHSNQNQNKTKQHHE